MATKIKNLSIVAKQVNKTVNQFLQDGKTQSDIAKRVQLEYRKNIREGFDVNSKSFPALQQTTIDKRAYLKETGNKTTKSFGLAKSNLTFTGELVQKIFIKFASTSKNKVFYEIDFRGVHKPYKTKSGQSNASFTKISYIVDIASGLLDKGFDLFGFPERKVPEVSKFAAKLFKRFLRRKN